MKFGPTITVAYHNLSLINTSQTQPLLIAVYLLSSRVQGFLDIDNGNGARVLPGPQGTHVVRLELGNSLFELRKASSLW